MAFGDRKAASAPGPTARTRKPPRRITPDYLERAALHYLQRYSSSEANLRRVLIAKVRRSCRHHGDDPERFLAAVDQVVARKVASGLIDDKRYAENRTASLERRGLSQRMIRLKLRAKGVARDIVEASTACEPGDEYEAARITARRKRVGPWRTRGDRADFRQKDIAALMRAGFNAAIVRAVIDADPDDPDAGDS
jgi:regulatory protein